MLEMARSNTDKDVKNLTQFQNAIVDTSYFNEKQGEILKF